MARSLFAGRPGDSVASIFSIGTRQIFTLPVDANGDPASVALTVWDEPDGTQLTDLLAADGTTPITQVVVPAATGQIPEFYGPDGFNVSVYIRDTDGDYQRLDARTDAFAEQVAADADRAEEAAASVQRDEPGGVAPLDGDSRVPQANLPVHLDPTELSASTAEQVSTEIVDEGSDIGGAVAGKFVTPWWVDLDPGEKVAPLPFLNPRDFGAHGDYQGGTFDDTAAIQATIQRLHDEGGGILDPGTGKYRIEQIQLLEGVHIRGTMRASAGVSRAQTATQFIQAEGSSVDMIIGSGFVDPAGGRYLLPCGLSNLTLYGNPGMSPSGLSGFASKDESGNALQLQHGCFFDRLSFWGFRGDGMWIPGGSGVQDISHIFGYMNGGYVIRIVGAGADNVQHVHLFDIAGDGNSGGAVVRIENQSAGYQTTIQGLKSEQVINFLISPVTTPGGSVVSNQNALHLVDCDSDVVVTGLEHIAGVAWSVVGGTVDSSAWTVTGGTKTKPGHAVKITNSNTGKRPTVVLLGKKIRSLAEQTGGSTPSAIEDLSNLGSRYVTDDGPTVVYGGHGTRTLVTREQSAGNFQKLLGAQGDHTMPSGGSGLSSELALLGTLPGYMLCATSAAANQKFSSLRNAGDGRTMLRMYKDDGTAIGDAMTWKTDGASITEWGMRGFVQAFPTYTQNYTTASRTVDAYTTNAQSSAYTSSPAALTDALTKTDGNALRAAYENLRASHDNLLKVVTAIIDDRQGFGDFK